MTWDNRRRKWGDGPWLTEPDYTSWYDADTGYPCNVIRHEHLGHLCGYVGIPPGNRWYGINADEMEPYPEVHGGVTYGGPFGTDPDLWWIGFDCSHAFDLVPGIENIVGESTGWTYRDMNYVKAQCTLLAAQAAEQEIPVWMTFRRRA